MTTHVEVSPPKPAVTVRTVLLTNKNRVHTWQTLATVESLPATVADLNLNARWFHTVGDQVRGVTRVQCSMNDVLFPHPSPPVTAGFEVVFQCGAIGFVPDRDHPELDALLVGTKGYLHGLAVWRKRGFIVGTPVSWFRAQPSERGYQNPNSAPRCCAAELYARARGESWGTV